MQCSQVLKSMHPSLNFSQIKQTLIDIKLFHNKKMRFQLDCKKEWRLTLSKQILLPEDTLDQGNFSLQNEKIYVIKPSNAI